MRDARYGLTLILTSAAAYGAMPVLVKVAYANGVTASGLLAYRFVIASVLFALLAPRGTPPLPGKTRLVLWGLGLVFVCNSLAYFTALRSVPASILALLLYTYPVLVTLLAAACGLEPLTPRGLASAALAFSGTALTAGSLAGGGNARGVFFALLAAFIYSVYIVLGSLYAATIPSEAAARHVAQVSAALYVPWAVISGGLALPASVVAWGAILGIALLCTVFALRAFLAGLARVGPSRAAVASSFEVLVTVLLAVLFLGETVGVRQWAGGVLILGGVALQDLGRRV
jgi:drug/metabolite transporter (DMT)-like permease